MVTAEAVREIVAALVDGTESARDGWSDVDALLRFTTSHVTRFNSFQNQFETQN